MMINYPILPFCKGNIIDFNFKIYKIDEKNCEKLVFSFNNYKIKITNSVSEENDYIIFGKYKDKYCFICEKNEIDAEFKHIMGNSIPEDIRTIAGIGISTLQWNKENKYCGKCGNLLEFLDNEDVAKYCQKCNHIFYPRLNPAIIIAVIKDRMILVTRKAEWKQGRYGLVAGFIEYGENIEEAAKREVFEETGIKIKNIKYVASQFWPFPYQLMIGLKAEYDDGEIVLDKMELAEAKWLKIDDLTPSILPPPSSIAYFLMKNI